VRERGSWAGVVALGILTITAFGSWFYAFGVLIDPITEDEGWSTSALGLTYGAAQVMSGIGAFMAGRALDRFGGAIPFLLHALLGGGLLFASSFADDVLVFGLLYAVGGGIIGATGFYSITAATSARLVPDQPDKAIAVLTALGALCSPIIIPLTAWLVTTTDWRATVRILSGVAAAGALLAAAIVGQRGAASTQRPSEHPLAALRTAVGRRPIRRMLAVYVSAGVAFSSVLVYQVPIMTAAGMSLGAAGVIAGMRGFCQIFGRVGLTRAVDSVGTGRLLRGAYVLGAAGAALLLVPTVPTGILYALMAGVGIGASAPLQTMYARAHFDESDLGLLLGLQGAAIGIAGGVGPLVGGVIHDLADTWAPVVVLTVLALALAATLLAPDTPDTIGGPTLSPLGDTVES
jgi:MFS family permease